MMFLQCLELLPSMFRRMKEPPSLLELTLLGNPLSMNTLSLFLLWVIPLVRERLRLTLTSSMDTDMALDSDTGTGSDTDTGSDMDMDTDWDTLHTWDKL